MSTRDFSTTLPTAALASQKRTAALPRRNTRRKDTGTRRGDTNPSRASATASLVGPARAEPSAAVHAIPQKTSRPRGHATAAAFRPSGRSTNAQDRGSYEEMLESHATRAETRSGSRMRPTAPVLGAQASGGGAGMADADADADADSDSGRSGRRHRVLTTLFPPMVGPAPGPPPSLGGPPPLRLSSFISVWGASEEDERFTIFNDARSARCPLRDALCAMRGEEW